MLSATHLLSPPLPEYHTMLHVHQNLNICIDVLVLGAPVVYEVLQTASRQIFL